MSVGTLVSVSVEVAVLTTGGVSLGVGVAQTLKLEVVLRGFGAPTLKSASLLSVSVHPLPLRSEPTVLLNVAAGPLPSKQVAPEKPVP